MKRLLAMFVALWVALPAWAGSARLQLDTQRLAVGQTGRLVLYLVDARTRNAPDIEVPDGLDLRFFGSSQRFSIDNFRRTSLYAYEYRITAREAGHFVLGPVEVQLVDGTVVRAEAVSLEVVPGSDRAESAPVRAQAGFGVETAWEGQVVVYGYRLVASTPILGAEWRLPEFDGLRQPQHGNPEERQYFVDEPDGSRTAVVEGAVPLLATGTGERDQQPAIARVRVAEGRSDLLGFRQYRSETLATEPAALTVRPLPRPPEGFSGLVGDFTFRAELGRDRAAVGESVPLEVEVVGDGSLEGWSLPALPVEGASVYDSDDVVGARVQAGSYVARGLFRRVLVPTSEGRLELPELTVVTFSPTRGEYVTHRVALGGLDVTAGREVAAELESFSAPLPEGEGGEALVPVAFRDVYTWGAARVWPIPQLLPLLLVPALAPGAFVLFGVVGERLRDRRAARREARRGAPRATELLRHLPQEPVARLATLDAALRLALARRAGVEPNALDRAKAAEGLPDALRARVEAAGRALDLARFAERPVPDDLDREIAAIVRELEAR